MAALSSPGSVLSSPAAVLSSPVSVLRSSRRAAYTAGMGRALWSSLVLPLTVLVACKTTLDLGSVEPGPPVACEKEGLIGPNRVSEADYASRYGASATRYSEAPTSKERPLEVCGIGASGEALTHLACDDGSRPFGDDIRAAAAARSGSVGSGGRCGSIIDLYTVPCPEGRYAVYVDAYFCGPGESPGV